MIERAYDIARKIIKQYLPDEFIYFDDLWGLLEPVLAEGRPVDLAALDREKISAFFAPSDFHFLKFPSFSITECVGAGVNYFRIHRKCPDRNDFKTFVEETLRGRHTLPKEKVKQLSEVAWTELLADLTNYSSNEREPDAIITDSNGTSFPEPSLYFTVWTEQGIAHGTKQDYLEKYEKPPTEKGPRIWINRISSHYSVRPKRKHILVNLSGKKLDLLCILLRKCDTPIPKADLEKEVTNYPQVLNDLHEATFGILQPFIDIEWGTSRRLSSYNKNDRRSRLTFCLIDYFEEAEKSDK